MSHKQVHIDGLKSRFEKVDVLRQTPSEMLLQVEHTNPNRGFTLTLYVALDARFPASPPTVAYFGGRKISIAPPNGSANGTWDPAKSELAEAVSNAFANVVNLWGNVAPPSVEHITSQLRTLSDSMLQDIITNPNCLESYAYQLPFLKAIRDASFQTISDIEREANENLTLQSKVEELREEVGELQKRLEVQVNVLQKAQKSTPLLNSIASPEALAKTFAADVKKLDAECDDIAKKLLEVDYGAERRRFDELMEEYEQRAKKRHMMDLKRRAYYASLT